MKKILIVDDCKDNISILKSQLSIFFENYEIIESTNGEDSLTKVKHHKPDVILLDINMPTMDGYEVCQKIRSNKKIPYIPIIFLTAFENDIKSKIKGFNLGADDYLSSFTDKNELAVRINNAIKIKNFHDSFYRQKKDLLKRIEKKALDLQKEKKKLEHINKILIAIRSINHLITVEKNKKNLLKEIANKLIEARGYNNIHIFLFNENGILNLTAEAHLSLEQKHFFDNLNYNIQECWDESNKSDVLLYSIICEKCSLYSTTKDKAIMCFLLNYNQKQYGLLSVTLPKDFVVDNEEISILKDVAEDISFALHNLKLEEDRKQVEEILRENEKKYRKITEAVTDYIYTVYIEDEKPVKTVHGPGCYTVTGYTSEDFEENQYLWINMVPEEDRSLVLKQAEATLKGEKSQLIEHKIIRKNGKIYWVRNTHVPYFDKKGNLLYYYGLIQNITKIKEAEQEAHFKEQQLIQAEKMASLGILVSGIAHEINNPNNFILLNAKIINKIWKNILPILDDYYNKNSSLNISGMPYEEVKIQLEQIFQGLIEGSNRIKNIVQSLKEFSQPSMTKWDEIIDINQVIKSTIIIMNNLIKKSTDNFIINYGQNIPKIVGSFQQLEQVIINLLSNACKAITSRKKRIMIITSYETEKKSIIIKVSDEGIGIPQEHMSKIMSPFFTTRFESGGTGLGLSISFNIIKKFEGDIQFESEVGKGTIVTVCLPVNFSN